ncbi:MerR family transcriptional regulator [Paenibacillus radicis (ex Xue et al. 2023)]|uniref:MerR family transcriptional regulator n=1 Tax=Paenibacillus radicis (ex Xue et al. 2023) TaxID=2972489 RepID=A0ABT1YPY9_9BACL|nr:MerR family transcriptional regulator [Paenibacillus radicis (ex Xue et al. 2023)]MCR8634333.1 MerR family transcriptional regulator [Paenibacillus radicis (ex Xue et al. 2023)]
MYSIGEISKLTGITAFTLRYYEKIGILPKPGRQDGMRRYDDQELQFIRFIHGLKQTGMSLESIAAFTKDGCILTLNDQDVDISGSLQDRISMLARHIDQLEQQIKHLETVKEIAQEKSRFYSNMLKEQAFKKVQSNVNH